MKMSRRTVLAGIGVMIVATLSPVAAGSQTMDSPESLQARFVWGGFADARAVSPYASLPEELAIGVPFARTQLDTNLVLSEGWAGYSYLSEILEEGILETTDYYEQNPTLVRCTNPDRGRGSKNEIAAGQEGVGGVARTDCETRLSSKSHTTSGPLTSDQASYGWAVSDARSSLDADRGVVSHQVRTDLQRFEIPGAVTVRSVQSHVRLDVADSGEPLIDFEVVVAGLHVGGQEVAGTDHKAVRIAGNDLTPTDAVREFHRQYREVAKQFDETGSVVISIVEPRVERHDDGKYEVWVPALDIRTRNAARRGTAGEIVGFRLGASRVVGWLFPLHSGAGGDGSNTSSSSPVTSEESFEGAGAGHGGGLATPAFATTSGIGSYDGSSNDEVLAPDGVGAVDVSPSTDIDGAEPQPVVGEFQRTNVVGATAGADVSNGFLGGIGVLFASLLGVGALTRSRPRRFR